MSTGQQHENKTPDLSFESIDDQINDYVNEFIDEFESLDTIGEGALATPQTAADRAQRLMTTYAGVRPILLALTSVPLVPETWRAAITVFVACLAGRRDRHLQGRQGPRRRRRGIHSRNGAQAPHRLMQ